MIDYSKVLWHTCWRLNIWCWSEDFRKGVSKLNVVKEMKWRERVHPTFNKKPQNKIFLSRLRKCNHPYSTKPRSTFVRVLLHFNSFTVKWFGVQSLFRLFLECNQISVRYAWFQYQQRIPYANWYFPHNLYESAGK